MTGRAPTERDLLDQLHRRYAASVQGGNRRFVVAEHVPVVPVTGKGDRIADFLAQDCHSSDLTRDGRPARARYHYDPVTRRARRVPDDAVQRRILHGHEVKVSRSDWLTELRDPSKAGAWQRYCDRWWLVTVPGVARPQELPQGWGLIVAGRIVVQAPVLDSEPMPAGTVTAFLRAVQRTAARGAATLVPAPGDALFVKSSRTVRPAAVEAVDPGCDLPAEVSAREEVSCARLWSLTHALLLERARDRGQPVGAVLAGLGLPPDLLEAHPDPGPDVGDEVQPRVA